MLERSVQTRVGPYLKRIYEDAPWATIPARLWSLLVALEREAAQAQKAPRV